MRVTSPKPQVDFIDVEEGLLQQTEVVTKRLESLLVKDGKYSPEEAGKRMVQFVSKGLFIRAIVTPHRHELPTDDVVNPKHWGVIVDVNPYQTKPFEVWYVDMPEPVLAEEGDIRVIHAGESTGDIKARLSASRLFNK